MQELKLADGSLIGLYDGTRRATIREGKRDITKGALALEAATGGYGAIVNVTDIKYKKFAELTREDAEAEGFESIAELTESLRQFYPNITPDTDVTLVFFDFKDPMDIPEEILFGTPDTRHF